MIQTTMMVVKLELVVVRMIYICREDDSGHADNDDTLREVHVSSLVKTRAVAYVFTVQSISLPVK